MSDSPKRVCIAPGCERTDVQFRRGLCPACHQAMLRNVAAGKTTKAAEVAAGRLLPNSVRRNPISVAIDAASA
ncbi:hypothetical protein [Alienimonas sp. DA493]|uniref:hypothetical protein n=1 Tax=Alienimonas sp. DA493 TaxID=3373605 RepID=UPI003754C2DA